jgi:hypothetical protein
LGLLFQPDPHSCSCLGIAADWFAAQEGGKWLAPGLLVVFWASGLLLARFSNKAHTGSRAMSYCSPLWIAAVSIALSPAATADRVIVSGHIMTESHERGHTTTRSNAFTATCCRQPWMSVGHSLGA